MTTIQGIINKGVVNSELQFEKMGYISTNVSNYNTNGYKAVRFEQMLSENGYLSGVERTDFSQGAIQRTQRDFDVAIDGMAYDDISFPKEYLPRDYIEITTNSKSYYRLNLYDSSKFELIE